MQRLFFITLAALALLAVHAQAQDAAHAGGFKPDDRVIFDVSAEDWVTTKTAHVGISAEAAVTSSTAGAIRADMTKAVNELAKADWRLTAFDRNQDQTGMERWSATYEARLPESDLSGLGDSVKKLSKAGMQLIVATIDFSPTLEEMETARSGLRTQIYKIVNDQLAALNAALPGRAYRIALINFTGDDDMVPMPRVVKGRPVMAMMMAHGQTPPETAPPVPMERAEKVSLTAQVVFAVANDAKPVTPPPAAPPSPAPAPAEVKH